MSELKDFLENVRKYSSKIGEVAMRHVSDVFSNSSNYKCQRRIYIKTVLLLCLFQTAEQVDVDESVIGKRKIVPIGNVNTFLGTAFIFGIMQQLPRKVHVNLLRLIY